MFEVEYNLYVHITGTVIVDEKPDTPDDLLEAIFPDGWDGEVQDVTTYPQFCSEGYMNVTEEEEE